MKVCSTCRCEKDDTEYSFRNKAKGLLQHQCNECRRITAKNSYTKHKKTTIASVAKRTVQRQQWFMSVKQGLSCCACGESSVVCLDFHHIDPTEKSFSLSDSAKTVGSKRKIIEEMNKCACLCSNCHRKHHAGILNAPLVKLEII